MSQDQQEGCTEGEVAGGGMKGAHRSPVMQGLMRCGGRGLDSLLSEKTSHCRVLSRGMV